MRGPLAQLYGNSSAGVIQVFTADGPERPEVGASLDAGAEGMRRWGLQAAGQQGGLNYLVDVSDFRTDGWRENSAARRRHLNARLRSDISDRTRLTVVANVFDQPVSGDPLGLTRDQMTVDPRQADSRSTDYQTGKDVSQRQLGLVLDQKLDSGSELMARVYAGQRDLDNRLSIPLFVQQSPTAAGGIVDLDRQYSGTGLRYSRRTPLGQGQLRYSVGLDVEQMDERRRGYINDFGTRGELKRDEDDSVRSTGIYAQADWAINEVWSAVAGLRANRVSFAVDDFYVRAGNPDDSGKVRFSATNPVLGITRHLDADSNLYANVGRGFETPTFTEIGYRSGGSGPNLDLKAARSTHMEVGYKTRLDTKQRLDVAVFHIATSDEIVVASSSGGRTIYTNAGRTRRSGIEVAHSAQWSPQWSTHVALSTLNARFADAFVSSSGSVVPKNNRIPGTLDRQLFAELAWRSQALPGFSAALEAVHLGRMAVDDLNTDRTDAATVFHLRLGWEQALGDWRLKSYLRVDNLTDKAYVGSVIANEGNRRFFEPAPGRQWGLGISLSHAF
ncbi:MAG: TonB-dependent receptor [Burkholderiaceae bacterium]